MSLDDFIGSTPKTAAAIAHHRAIQGRAQRDVDRDAQDLPRFVALWLEAFPLDTDVLTVDLCKLAIKGGLFPSALRRTVFKTKCSRLSELIGRTCKDAIGEHRIMSGVSSAKRKTWRLSRVA